MPSDAILTIPKHVLSESLNDEMVLLDMRSGAYFGLSPVASRFWQLVGEGATLEQIEEVLLNELEVEPEMLRADLGSLLKDLEGKKLVVRESH